jgi:integrase
MKTSTNQDPTGPIKFTETALKELHRIGPLRQGQKDRLVFDTECAGLGVRLTASGKRTFIVQWTDPATKRKVRDLIGVWGAITIKQARNAATARLGDVARGINPRIEREHQRRKADRERAETALTFERLIREWHDLHLVGRRKRYSDEAVRAIRRAFPDLLRRPAARIEKSDAVNALDRLVRDGKAAMAGRTLAYARAAFRWAERRGKVPVNPFQGLPVAAGNSDRERVLTDEETADIWRASGKLGYPWGPFYRLALLTLQRREEVAAMRWSEFDAEFTVWNLGVKGGKRHIIHLTDAAREVLCNIPRVDGIDLVFTTTGSTPVSGFSKAKIELNGAIAEVRVKNGRAATLQEPWRLHDFRRSGASKLAELGFDPTVIDLLLSHQPKKLRGVAGVYQRYDFARERKQAIEAWAAHVTAISSDRENVVELAERRA